MMNLENPLNEPNQLKIMVLNAQDLFLFMDLYDGTPLSQMNEIKWNLMSSSLIYNKSKEKCFALGRCIQMAEADIVMMTEVGGLESLTNFAMIVLGNTYKAFSLPSNSDRGIDLGYLVKSTLPYGLKLCSHIDYPIGKPAKRFSRDILQLSLSKGSELKIIFLLAHIKSKLDMNKKDFEGRAQRALEIKGLIDIYNKLRHSHKIPILVGGDFNGNASEIETEEEFKLIYQQTDLVDIAKLAELPPEDRFSYVYFNRGGQRFFTQIDYLFISKNHANLISFPDCYFPRYQNSQGAPLPIPIKFEQKSLLPSDHYPFVATMKFPPPVV